MSEPASLPRRALGFWPALALVVVGSFAGHAVAGPNGLLAWGGYHRELQERKAELAALVAERAQLRHRSALLDPRKADPDMADELAGYRPIDDVVVPDAPVYLLLDVDTGAETLNVRPDDALPLVRSAGRTPLTIDETSFTLSCPGPCTAPTGVVVSHVSAVLRAAGHHVSLLDVRALPTLSLLTEDLRDPNGKSKDADVYFSSKGHDVPALYSLLIATGKLGFDLLPKLRQSFPGAFDAVGADELLGEG